MNKKIISILLAAGIAAASVSAFAVEENTAVDTPMLISEQTEVKIPYIEGTVKAVSETELTVGENTYALTDKTLVYENTGKKVNADAVKQDGAVFVVSDDGKTADVIVVKNEDCINGIAVNTFDTSDTFGTVVDKDNTLALHLNEDSLMVDTEENHVKLEDIKGKRLLVFCGPVAMSIPGQTTPDKVVVLGEGEAPAESVEANELTANFFKHEEIENAYVAGDNSLVILIGEETKVTDKDGKEYTGSLDNKNLTVTYTVATRSLPPQTTPSRVVVNGDAVEGTELTDTFFAAEGENKYVNADNSLVILIGDTTKVTDKDGKEYTGSLDNKDLTVTYTVTTRSLPPQTTPETVVVLGEGTKKQEPLPTIAPEVTAAPTSVEAGNFKEEVKVVEGIVLIPVRGVCEALGVTVEWNGENRGISLAGKSGSVYFEVEKEEFEDENGSKAKAQIIEDRTYAPTGLFAKLGLKIGRNGESVTVTE